MLLPEIAAEIQDDNYTDMRSLVSSAELAEHRRHLRRQARDSINPLSLRPKRDESRGGQRDNRCDDRYRSLSRNGYNSRNYRSPPPDTQNRTSGGYNHSRPSSDCRDDTARSHSRLQFNSQTRECSGSRSRHEDEANVIDAISPDLNC